MSSFVRVVEIWVPDDAGTRLTLHAGAYGSLSAFADNSRESTFAPGEGLPGLAWQAAVPIVMRNLYDAAFLRATPAQEAGLTSGVAIPIIQGHTVRAVLVFLCGDKGESDGAIEIWKDDGHSGQSLVDGYYGGLNRFEHQSRNITFAPGWGLPGMVWKSASPQIVDVANTNSFLSSQAALESHISIGIGIPVNSNHNVDDIGFVVSFLSVHSTPIAKRFEVWTVADDEHLYFESGLEDPRTGIAPRDPDRIIVRGEGTVGKALQTGLPCIESRMVEETDDADDDDSGLSQVAIPVYYLEELRSVVSFSY